MQSRRHVEKPRRVRETQNFIVYEAANNKFRIEAKAKNVIPGQRTVKASTWEQMEGMSEREFEGTCVMDLNIGTHEAAKRVRPR